MSFEVTVEDDDAQPAVNVARAWAALQGLMAVAVVVGVAAVVLHITHGTAVCGEEEAAEEEEYTAMSGKTLMTPLLNAQHFEQQRC